VNCSPLAVLPTPVHRAPRLERALGTGISVAVDRARAGPVVVYWHTGGLPPAVAGLTGGSSP